MKATLDRALLEARQNAEMTGEIQFIEAVEEACEHIERRMEPRFAPPELVLDQVRLSSLAKDTVVLDRFGRVSQLTEWYLGDPIVLDPNALAALPVIVLAPVEDVQAAAVLLSGVAA